MYIFIFLFSVGIEYFNEVKKFNSQKYALRALFSAAGPKVVTFHSFLIFLKYRSNKSIEHKLERHFRTNPKTRTNKQKPETQSMRLVRTNRPEHTTRRTNTDYDNKGIDSRGTLFSSSNPGAPRSSSLRSMSSRSRSSRARFSPPSSSSDSSNSSSFAMEAAAPACCECLRRFLGFSSAILHAWARKGGSTQPRDRTKPSGRPGRNLFY